MSSTSSPAELRQISSEVRQQQSIPEEEEEEQQQQTIPKEQQEEMTLFNLPEPYLMNTVLEGRRRVPHLVLAFPFDSEDQLRCAEVNNLRPDLESSFRQMVALSRVRWMLPRHCDIDPIRWKNRIGSIMAILVASNATPRSLALMHDIDRLKEVQRILGTDKCPRWARLAPDDY